jgi:hypothetical protein
MKLIEKYKAFDGTEFYDPSLCKAHERKNAHLLLVNCTEENILAAVEGKPEAVELADAIEIVGSRIARMRLASGKLKRAANGTGGAEPARQITHQPAVDGEGEPDFSDVTSGAEAET